MEWWQWIVLGAGILAAETIIDSEFYLIFIGLSAITVGLSGFAPYSLPLWGQWILFATLAAGSTIIFRGKLYERLRGNPAEVAAGVVGETAIALDPIGVGERGQVELRGATWAAKNTGDSAIPASGRARVSSRDGLTLYIQPDL
jgi:membrane protein implicated in regulation of membrane protease activity